MPGGRKFTETLRNWWTSSEIDAANYCGMRWYLQYVERVKQQRLSFFEKGSLLHILIENFWENLGKKYKTEKEFAKHAQGHWMRKVIGSKESNRPIIWKYDNEQWVIRSEIGNIATRLYDKLKTEGPPLYAENKFDFVFDLTRWRGRLDEIRMLDGGPLIRDWKSGRPNLSELKRNFDPQPTFYFLGLSGAIKKDPEMAKTLNLESELDEVLTEKRILSDRIKFEYCMIDDENLITHRAERNDINYFQLKQMISGIMTRLKTGAIYPEFGRKCDYCPVKEACIERNNKNPEAQHSEKNQFFFDYGKPHYLQNQIISKETEQMVFKLRSKRKKTISPS